MQKYIFTVFTVFFGICFSCSLALGAADYGVKAGDVQAMLNIQNQLTENYINNTAQNVSLQKTEAKVLDSKIEGLILEDVIAGYDSDIAVLEKQLQPLINQLQEPKQKIAEKESKKNEIRNSLEKQSQILSRIYLEMLFEQKTENKTFSDSFLSQLFVNDAEQLSEVITEDALKKIERKTLEIYIALLKQFKNLQMEQDEIKTQIAPLQQKYDELSNRRDKLEQEKSIKEESLASAKAKKEYYEDVLQESRDQVFISMQEAMSSDNSVIALQKKLDDLEAEKDQKEAKETARKMQDLELKDEYSPEELTPDMVAAISKKVLSENIGTTFFSMWPVDPNKGISAHFQDSEYKQKFKMQHNAIDIPIPQGTPIRSPADGYVYKTVDNGMGYSYIIVLHRNNVRTVYGHVSGFAVKAGTMVSAGDIIGYSGGTPGTKGAGKMTTGAHLHFEVLVNEVYKNPIHYLPKQNEKQ